MTDPELIEYLGLGDVDPALAQRYVSSLTQEKRELFERMLEVELWDQGAGPLPAGVIVCKERKHGRLR